MIKLYQLLFLLLILVQNASAGFDDLKATIESTSCRLANVYTYQGADYSGSAGITVKGKYRTEENETLCLERCKKDVKSRLEEKPDMYGLKVACFFGDKKLFLEEYK